MRPALLVAGLCLANLLIPVATEAKIYRYIDPQGRLLLTDTPRHRGYIPLIKTPEGWVPQSQYRYDSANRQRYSAYIRQAADKHRLPYYLLHAVIMVESAYNARAISRTGAQGLMQLMPATARRFGVDNVFNPEDNINGGSRYLSHLIALFNGDIRLALAAYNAGENAVKKYGNRIPPYKETQRYVHKVMATYQKYRLEHSPPH
ncbi:MAG: lytic transglycosylase domain-containing protein [Cellvibrionaceae bacterium]|nr:lytic transglycosylase domain-containing protein [Cellvibrionaceae bacterium]